MRSCPRTSHPSHSCALRLEETPSSKARAQALPGGGHFSALSSACSGHHCPSGGARSAQYVSGRLSPEGCSGEQEMAGWGCESGRARAGVWGRGCRLPFLLVRHQARTCRLLALACVRAQHLGQQEEGLGLRPSPGPGGGGTGEQVRALSPSRLGQRRTDSVCQADAEELDG